MRGPWIPRFCTGGASNETIDGYGTEGRYFQLNWLGFLLFIEFGSVYAEDRWWKRNGGKPKPMIDDSAS